MSAIHLLVVLLVISLTLWSSHSMSCDETKIDSIEYLKDLDLWFFTSGQLYWLISDNSFPPNINNALGRLPNGFDGVDASVYIDGSSLCGLSDSREVLVVKLIDNQMKAMVFHILTRQWSASHSWIGNKFLKSINISEPIDGMFTIDGSLVFVVRDRHYSVIDFRDICNDNDLPKLLAKNTFGDEELHFDAITMRSTQMYRFVGNHFQVVTIDQGLAKKGFISVLKTSASMNVSKDFFRFEDCSPLTKKRKRAAQKKAKIKASKRPKNNSESGQLFEVETSDGTDSRDEENAEILEITFLAFIFILIVLSGVIIVSARPKSEPLPVFEVNDGRPETPNSVQTVMSDVHRHNRHHQNNPTIHPKDKL